jgi:hypothetical protein
MPQFAPLCAIKPQLTIALTSVVSALWRAINLPVELAGGAQPDDSAAGCNLSRRLAIKSSWT